MSYDDIIKTLRTVPDFPKPGISFKDITPVFQNPKLFNKLISGLEAEIKKTNAEAILGIEARGFILGAPIAINLGLPFIPARKAGKLPAETIQQKYQLEYGEAALEIHTDSFAANTPVAVVDDLLATGGTASAAGELIKKLDAKIAGYFFAIELAFLSGRTKLDSKKVASLITI